MPQGYEQNKGRRIRKGLVASMSAFAMLLTGCSSAEKRLLMQPQVKHRKVGQTQAIAPMHLT